MTLPLQEIKDFLSKAEIPKTWEIQKGMIVTDPKKFIESHISTIEKNGNNKTFDSFKTRLQAFCNSIKSNT